MLLSTALPAQTDGCESLLKATSQQQIQHLSFFDATKPIVFVTLCRDSAPEVFEQFYAYLHPVKNGSTGTPKAGLNRIKQVLRPEHEVFATGVLAIADNKGKGQESQTDDPSNELEYQLRVRVRINKGEATDLMMNAPLSGSRVLMDNVQGFTIMLVQNQKYNLAD